MESDKFQELVLQQLRTLTEGQARVEGRLDKLGGRLDRLEGRLDTVEGRLDGLGGRLDKLELRMENEAFSKIAALFDGFQSLSETLADHTARLQRIEEKVTDHDIRIEVLDKTKSGKHKAR